MAKKPSDGITDETLADPNVQKFLEFIGKAEGADYNVIVGGKKFDDFSKHPGVVGLRTKEGPSTAAGRYQITKTTYNDFAPKLGITDFSPQSQDRIAVAIFQREKALDDIRSGDFESAINKLGGRFASLPSSKYSQPKKSWDFVQAELGTVTAAPSKTQKMAAATQPEPFKVAAGPKAPPKAAKVALTDLPDTYRSALALNFLVDSDPEDELMSKATELLQASMPQQGGGPAGGTILQKYAAQMPEVNPYQFLQPPPTDQVPARMAAGGLVVGGTTLPFVPGPSLTQEQMDLIKQREEQYAKYEPLAKEYETQAEAYNQAIDEYNKKAELYNQKAKVFGDVQYATANYGATPYNLGVSYSAAENRRKNQMIRDAGLKPGSSGLYDTSFFLPEDDSYVWEQTRDTPGGVLYYGDLYKRGGAYPGEFTQQAPTAPDLGFDPAQHEQFVTQAQKDALLRAQALQVASDPGRFNLSGLSAFGAAESPNPVAGRRPGVIPRMPRMFQAGGEVAEEPKTDYRITGAVDRINEELAELVRNYRITGTGAEKISAITGLPVVDISRMFGATDTSLPSADIAKQDLQVERFLDKTPQVMTDEGTRIAPGYVLRSVPKDLTGPNGGETLEEYVRRFNIRRSGVNPKVQMFQAGGEVTGDDLFAQMIGGQPTPPMQAAVTPAPSVIQSEVPQVDEFNRVVRAPAQPAPQRSILQELVGGVEAATTMGTGILSTVPAAVSGYASLLTPGTSRADAEKAMSETMRRFTYLPKGEAGQENVENLGKFLQATKLDAAMPQAQLMNLRVAPGAVRYLGDRAVEATERGVMPTLRAQTQDPNLQPTDVYRAMADTRGTMLSGPRPIYGGLAPVTEGLLKKGEEDTKRRLGDNPSVVYDGVTYAATPRVLSFIEKAEKIKQNLPPVEQGMTRLWRGNRPGEESQNPSFTNSINGIALPFQEAYGGPLTYVDVPTNKLDSYLTGGAPGSEFMLPAELATKAKIAFSPKQKIEIDRSLLFPSPERPFVGELERRVADLPGPVQKEQFINSLRKTAREHEMVRLEQALENYGPKDKLTPNQIMSLLKDTSPQRYQLEVLEPQANRFYAGQDTPYPSLPLGTANLLLEPKQLQREIVGLMDEAQYMRSSMFADSIASDETKLKEFLANMNKLADRAEDFDTELSRKIKQSTENFYEKVEPIAAASRVRQYVSYPSLSSNPDGLSNVVFSNLEGTLPLKIKTVLNNRGIDFTDNRRTSVTALFLAAREAAMSDYLKSMKALADTENDAGTYLKNTMSASERDKLNEMLSPDATWKEELGEFYKAAQEIDANKSLPIAEKHEIGNRIGQEFATKVNEMLSDFDYNLTATRKAVAEDLRAIPQMVLDSEILQENKLFEGTHSSVVRKNPISFSRYVDLDADQYNLPDPRGAMLFTELQSDRRKAVKKGVPGVEEPYPGMAKLSEDTLRELMAKSAVAATARRGKGIALFPSTDSQKAGLYSNMDRIAKKVAKDLGEGYQARQFDVVNEAGDTIKRWGIVLPDDASNLPQKGIRFAKGGFVDKPLYDRAQ